MSQSPWLDGDAAFDAGAERSPSPDTMYGLARILMAQDRPSEAIALLRNTIGQYPNYLPAYTALAEAHLWVGRTDDATETLTAGVQRAPREAVLLNNLGMIYFMEEQYTEALHYFDRAAAARPEQPLYRANKAAALGMLGRVAEARELYRQIVNPADAERNIDILTRARHSADRAARQERAGSD